MKHLYISILASFASCFLSLYPLSSRAQIGYQVSLLNTATGEPRAGVTVNAAVTITDATDKVVYSGSQQVTSNDFGVLSLVVGNADTFANADYSKLPFFISVSVDGTLIGKSQILSVPVAEYAKRTGELTKEKLVGTWVREIKEEESHIIGKIVFSDNGTFIFTESGNSWGASIYGTKEGGFFITGNALYVWTNSFSNVVGSNVNIHCEIVPYIPQLNVLCWDYAGYATGSYTKQ